MYRADFPIFATHPDLVYLDSASSTQKPQKVISAMTDMMTSTYANIHRWSYELSERSEDIYQRSKEKLAIYIGARSRHEIIYTANATYAFNLLSRSLIKSGLLERWDRVVLSLLEHHANIVAWQILAEEYGIVIEWVDMTGDGRIDYEDLEKKISGAKVLSLTAASNVTGAVTDLSKVKEIITRCEAKDPCQRDMLFIVDGSQALGHFSIDVEKYGIDFYIATGHKVFSDTGIGILYGKKDLLKKMSPALCGGGAINSVSVDGYEPAWLPYRYEPGTPHIIWAASFLAALEYIESIWGYEAIEKYEADLIEYTLTKIRELPESVKLIGPKDSHLRVWVFSFAFDHHHPRDIADALADAGICVRAGHHCTEPLHHFLGLPATLRMSLSIYSTREDIDTFVRQCDSLIMTH
jgi:cysteine desulfurase / selenocysteine lyase